MTQSSPITIDRASAADLEAARGLFTQYPYKAAQQIVQKLDKTRLTDFYAANLRKALEAGFPHWLARAEGEALALAGLTPDAWHSSVYGLKMGKIGPWLNTRRAEAGEALLPAVERQAREEGYEHLSARVDGEDFANLHLFTARGWRLVDVSLKFSRPMPFCEDRLEAPQQAGGWTVDLARPEDSDWIRHSGSRTHGGTHFLNDPALPREKTEELFARWLERCIDRLAYRIFVLRDPQGQGRGFVTYLRSQAFARAVGRSPLILDFVLLDPALRGGGFGPWLIGQSLAREANSGFDYCELRTSAHNLPAVIGYEKLGFRCCATDFALHKA